MPREFQVQHSKHANPPTMFLAVQRLLTELEPNASSSETAAVTVDIMAGQKRMEDHSATIDTDKLTSFREMYALLDRHYQWFMRTQAGVEDGTYRWRGRSPGHTLSSGLDDYPRGGLEPSDEERHLDLYCWVYMMTHIMHDMRMKLFGEDEVTSQLTDRMTMMRNDLHRWHWNDRIGWYSDHIYNGNYSDHIGYVSLFPLFMEGLLQTDHEVQRALDIIRDRALLWSPCGLRSLARNDTLYGTEENYWRGPIWININYLTLRALHRVAQDETQLWDKITRKRANKIYRDLRDNVLTCLDKSFRETGTLFEQYHAEDGKGLRAHPFTGWSSLVLLIAAEMY